MLLFASGEILEQPDFNHCNYQFGNYFKVSWIRLFHFSLSFLDELIIDYVLSEAIDEALEEATLGVPIIRFFPQEAVPKKGIKAFLVISFIFFFLSMGIFSSETFWNLLLEALPSKICKCFQISRKFLPENSFQGIF
jgi:hypothetical protein